MTDTTLRVAQTAAKSAPIASRHATRARSDTDLCPIADIGPVPMLPGGFIVQVEQELQLVTARSTDHDGQPLWKVDRGVFGTAKAAHSAAATVSLVTPQVQTAAPAAPPAASDGGGGGLAVVDLGVVNAVDTLNGPVTLRAAGSPSVISLLVGDTGFVVIDQQYEVDFLIGTFLDFIWSAADPDVPTLLGKAKSPVVTSAALTIRGVTENSGLPINGPQPAWAATHVYAASFLIRVGSHIWSTSGGTSGGSAPDFAGNIGGTVADNGMTWTDEGAVPTTGSLHLYALVGPPS